MAYLNSEIVAKGAAWLDSVRPDWFREINTATLRVETADHCVLTQLYGDYFTGRNLIPQKDCCAYGFCGYLTPDWLEAINDRLHPLTVPAEFEKETVNV